jgi:hypothetical protein
MCGVTTPLSILLFLAIILTRSVIRASVGASNLIHERLVAALFSTLG